MSCQQALRSLRERSADAPGDHSSCPRPSPSLSWLFPVPGYGAAYVTGWEPGAGLGALVARDGAVPTSPYQDSHSVPLFSLGVCGGGGGLQEGDHRPGWDHCGWCLPKHFVLPSFPPILAQKVAQPPSFHQSETTKQPLSATQPYAAWVLSAGPDPQRKKQACQLRAPPESTLSPSPQPLS